MGSSYPGADGAGWRRVTYDATGIVQGVGFRPAIYRLARAAGLGGSVQNRSGSVRLVLEGPPERIDAFVAALADSLPPAARLDRLDRIDDQPAPVSDAPDFVIAGSGADAATGLSIPADLALCADCRREIFDPADRRYGYAFTTCTRCGPRYTVIHGLPYDRARTTLSAFPLCHACRNEYEDPGDRRFHAESIACPRCGPRLSLEDAHGAAVAGDPLRQARAALAAGAVVAVRGLGGFLLAADAADSRTLAELRQRKHRPHKPFAVQARSLAAIRQVCACDAPTEAVLASAAAPIAILDLLEESGEFGLSRHGVALARLSPDTRTLGVMLAATPLQALLATPLAGDPVPAFDWLVMTSGNRGGEPICVTNAEARARLAGIADFFLLHDREINLRCDDSIVALQRGAPQVWRRARGFAPNPIRLRHRLARTVLAMGAELKNAIAIGYGDRVIASPHIGDLEAPEAVDSLRQVAEALPRFVDRVPEVVAVDGHPDLHATRVGREIAQRLGVPVVEVQHHHAHAAAGLGEHGRREGLALVFDGAGLGTDGRIWGAELMAVDGATFRRLASFEGVPLPGGDAAVRQPARQLAGRCLAAGIDLPPAFRARLGIGDEAWHVWRRQAETGLNAPVTHAAGRLFDACAAALGLAGGTATYEGQTAVRLEAAARACPPGTALPAASYRAVPRDGMLWIDWSDVFRVLCARRDPAAGDASVWAAAIHAAIANAAAEMIEYGVAASGYREIVLSGGVFMNRILTGLLTARLEAAGLTVWLHRDTPPNDGCIAIGQALVAGEFRAARNPEGQGAG